MPNVKCTCQRGFHETSSAKVKCLSKRGEIKRKGNKRIDPVLKDMRQMEQDHEEPQRNRKDSQVSGQSKAKNAQISRGLSTFQGASHTERSALNDHHQEVSREVNIKNFSRLMRNDKPQYEPNILEQLAIFEKNVFDNNKQYLRRQNVYGKGFVMTEAMKFQQRKNKIFGIIQKNYSQHCVEQLLPMPKNMNFQEMKEYVEKKNEIQSRCRREWQYYLENAKHLGKFGKFDAKLQPIQEFLEHQNWDKVLENHQKLQKYQQLMRISPQQRQQRAQKLKLFNKFKQITANEIEPLFYRSEKKVITDQDGNYLDFQRTKPVLISEEEQKQYRIAHEKDIKERFDNIFRYAATQFDRFSPKVTDQIFDQVQKYSQFVIELRNFHMQRRRRAAEAKIQRDQIFQKYLELRQIKKKQQQKKKETSTQKEVNTYQPFARLANTEKIVISDEQELIQYIDYQLYLKRQLKKDMEDRSIACKLIQLRAYSTLLVPQGFSFGKNSKPKTVIYFIDSVQTRSILSKFLVEVTINIKNHTKGYQLRPKTKEYLANQQEIVAIRVQQKRKSTEIWKKPQKNIQKQVQFYQKNSLTHEILNVIYYRLQYNIDRKKKWISINHLAQQDYKFQRYIHEIINCFANLFQMDQHRYILCSSLKLKQIDQQIEELKMYILNQSKNQA